MAPTAFRTLVAGLILGLLCPVSARAQSMPGPVYHALLDEGAAEVAERMERRLEPAADPDRDDVEDVLRRWREATGGPRRDWDWLAVARLWVRAGDPDQAEDALRKVGSDVPEAYTLLESARIGFLRGEAAAADDWWAACRIATEASALETWIDLSSLATADELEEWDRFRTLSAGQRDDCRFFRRFLNRRAIASGMPVDARLAQHYERLRFARERYGRRGKETGTTGMRHGLSAKPPFDDRGLLHVRMGQPDHTASYLAGVCYEPNVTWAYEDPDGIRLYHLTSGAGTDDWWLIENLALVFRCPVDPRTGQVIETRNPMVALPPVPAFIPAPLLYDLYNSRAVLDLEYARMASRFGPHRTIEQLQVERNMTVEDARNLIERIPERPDLNFELQFDREWLQFRSPRPSMTRVWAIAELPGDDIRRAAQGGGRARVEVGLSLLDDAGESLEVVPASFELEVPLQGETADVLGIRIPVHVPPGRYETLLQVRIPDPSTEGPTYGNFVRDSLVVRDFDGTLPLLSEVAVSPDSGGAWQPGPGLRLRPSPSHRSGPDGLAWIYLEAYNLAPGGEYVARVRLLPRDSDLPRDPAFEQEYRGSAARGARIVTPILLRLELGETPAGSYDLLVSVTDVATGSRTLDSRTRLEVSGPP